jgi:drug/metabolite transporter (DMT)-like permease
MSSISAPASPAPHWLGLVSVVLAAVLFAGKGVLVRMAYQHGADATGLLGIRLALSLPVFAALAWWMGRKAAPLTPVQWTRLISGGILGYHLASWLNFLGLERVEVALERVILFIYPTLLVAWALARGQRSADKTLVIGLAMTVGGIALTWGDRALAAQADTVGVLLVAASAVAFAASLVINEPEAKALGGIRSTSIAMTAACVTGLVHALLARPSGTDLPHGTVLGLGAALAIGATVVPTLLMGLAIEHLGAARTAVAGSIAPALTALLGWATLGEVLGPLGWLGIAATTAGAVVAGRPRGP